MVLIIGGAVCPQEFVIVAIKLAIPLVKPFTVT